MSLLLANGARQLKPQRFPRVCFLTDEARTPRVEAALARLPRGSAVILRHYAAANRADVARRIASACRRRGLLFLVAADWRLAAALAADGLHLPEHAAKRGPSSGARLWLRRRFLSVAAHSARGLARAHAIGADAALLSPVLPTRSHPERAALGVTRAAAWLRTSRVPVLALGGVSPRILNGLRRAGFAGIAGISFAVDA